MLSLANYLFLLFIEPLRLLFEVVYFYAYKLTSNCGLSIIAMSLVVNFLLLPLYFRADKLEKEQNDKKKKMEPWVNRIKKNFKGDERIMMLQAYYKENNYKSTDVFKESVSLFLQIPFFIAAYSFLSGLQMLHGVSLGPIADLGLPDGLIPVGSLHINLLPILMTVINIISGFIYSEKGHFKDKIKLILIALVFLVLLYGSPSGLVFYWTLNNLFSLIKNVVVHIRKPKAAKAKETKNKAFAESTSLIGLSLAILASLSGLMIPSDVIVQNPQEMVNLFSANSHTPVLYLINSCLVAIGLFLIWIPLFCYLTKEKTAKAVSFIAPILALNGIVNYVLFNVNFGLLTKKLIYENPMVYEMNDVFLDLMADISVALAISLLVMRYRKTLKYILLVAAIAVSVVGVKNVIKSNGIIADHTYFNDTKPEDISVPMTTTGENVVVIMMDRMMGTYIPYIFNERPDVAAQFDGFTMYPNVLSYGGHTNFAAPALFGGYEYTPARINARSDELLVDKHNEALRVMPTIFADNGWRVSVGDPSYANYEWIPDVSIYDDNENINAFLLAGTFDGRSDLLVDAGERFEFRMQRNLFCYGLMKTMPCLIQPAFYADGTYDYIDHYYEGYVDNSYVGTSFHFQIGVYDEYIQHYEALNAIPEVIEITDDPQNCFFMFANGTTHEVCVLQEPEYQPAPMADNTDYDAAHEDRFTVDGITLDVNSDFQVYAHYECNMAACIELGQFFDFLRANDLWENTRIIIVSDHGYNLQQYAPLMMTDPDFNVQEVNPILLIKDFGSNSGFTICNDFMTNADTPFLTMNGIIDNPVNPFTGNPITAYDKSEDHLIYLSEQWNVNYNNGTQFNDDPEGYWMRFNGDNVFDNANWHNYTSE